MNGENNIRVPGTPVTGVSQDEPSSSENVPRNHPACRGRRGTRMMDVTLSRTSGSRLEIQFHEKLQPVGPNKSKYNSFVGYLARCKVSILIDEWKKVDFDTVKQPIWDTIRLTYTIPNSEELKDKTLSYCADWWRKFKTFIANTYIFAEVPPAIHP
ncbi:hypothetical protein QN277_011888 [Acacia crassicarpa]|uniref:Uncharacterized protein n=1 Tax=Acacia crassicarpa TaxID=499986 RepID=A0AAE1MZR4_9FABA|nr:hypothetical protein QN277_011888 [Acacia crassicarpa]